MTPMTNHAGSTPERPRPFRSARLRRWLGLVLLGALVSYVVASLGGQAEALKAALKPGALPWLGLAGLLLVAGQLTMAWRQVVLLRHAGVPASHQMARRVIFAGLFANNFMPAGTGYDLVRLYFFRGQGGQTGASVGGLVLLDRFLGLMGLSVLALGGFCALSLFYPAAVPGEASRLLLLATLLPLPLGLAILAVRHGAAFDRFSSLAGRLPLGAKLQEMLAGFRAFSSRRRILLAVLGLAALGHVCSVAAVAAIAQGLYGQRAALGSVLVSPLVFFASSIPVTPANLGWTETVADAVWAVFGLSGGMLVFLCWRAVGALVSLAGARAYLSLRRGRAGAAEGQP